MAFDGALLRTRLQRALALRERLFERPFYRLCHAESDGIPGLVIDRYGDALVVQIGCAAVERRSEDLLDVLNGLLAPAVVVLRNDAASREHEGLPREVRTVRGSVDRPLALEENGAHFTADVLAGQKTGWFYDHRCNRERLAGWARRARVLDLFSYSGAWGVQAAVAGATSVTCVDSSEAALATVVEHARLNRVEGQVEVRQRDAFEALREAREAGEQFDVVVLDPPAFVRRRKDLRAGVEAYGRLARLATRVLAADGLLVAASCSAHLSARDYLKLLGESTSRAGAAARVIWQGHQGPDHPVLPAMPESEYLKAFFLRVTH